MLLLPQKYQYIRARHSLILLGIVHILFDNIKYHLNFPSPGVTRRYLEKHGSNFRRICFVVETSKELVMLIFEMFYIYYNLFPLIKTSSLISLLF